MFHVLLLPMALAGMAAYLFVLSIPFCIGMALQLLLTVFGQKRWVLLVPAGLGVLGLISCLIYFTMDAWDTLLIYWAVYFLALWLVWLVVSQIKKEIVRHKKKE